MNKTEEKTNNQQVLSFSDIGLSESVKQASPQEFAAWIRLLRQNWRQGTVGVKGRSDVARSTRKPWKQKGTGRARAGTARSPLWRGGGVTFGPQPRTRTLKFLKNCRKNVLLNIITGFLNKNRIVAFDWETTLEKPKTSEAYSVLKKMGCAERNVIVCITKDNEITGRSFLNIPHVQVALFDQLNAYDLALAEYLVVLRNDIPLLKEMVAKWS